MDQHEVIKTKDPVALAAQWLDMAAQTEVNDPNAMSLATVDAGGMPNVRIVLLKGFEAGGIVFYTNYESNKGQELDSAGKAALCLHWKSIRRQVRMRGTITRLPAAQSDAYYASRALESRLGAWASQQSRPLADRAALEEQLEQAKQRFGDSPQRPLHWGGYVLTPLEMEFWIEQPSRLHDRFVWKRQTVSQKWQMTRLNP